MVQIDQIHTNNSEGSIKVLLDHEAKRLLTSRGIQTSRFRVVESPDEAVQFANDIGYPVVLKGISSQAIHKSEVGGVLLNLRDSDQLIQGYKQIEEKLNAIDPGSTVIVEEMVQGLVEIIVGVTTDNHFGKVLLCGMGGIFTEVFHDTCYGMIPIDELYAKKMINSLRGAPLLLGYRGRPQADVAALTRIMISVSEMVMDNSRIVELDLNPVIVSEDKAVVVDARIILQSENEVLR
jgi:acyl-CoA synthetase (NDP forming)